MARGFDESEAESLLDVLIGEADDSSHRRGVSRHELESAVRRDLEDLLNTRWRCRSWPAGLDELERSLVNYGIPDFCGVSFGDADSQRELRRVIEQCITRFEPRLRRIRVAVPRRDDQEDRVLRFRIEAELRTSGDSDNRPIAFETSLDPTTSRFRVGVGT